MPRGLLLLGSLSLVIIFDIFSDIGFQDELDETPAIDTI